MNALTEDLTVANRDDDQDNRHLRPLALALRGKSPAETDRTESRSIVTAMMRPEFYPESPANIEFKQTHISYVFLANGYAYKFKKAVRFPFIDCVKLASRYQLCANEVRLNARISPDVYIGVFAVFKCGESYRLGPMVHVPDEKAVEYVVKMRRLPDHQMLDRCRAICIKIANFRRRVPAEHGWRYGCAATLQHTMAEETAQNQEFIGDTLRQHESEEISAFIFGFIAAHSKRLDRRAAGGQVREGHGDLRGRASSYWRQ